MDYTGDIIEDICVSGVSDFAFRSRKRNKVEKGNTLPNAEKIQNRSKDVNGSRGSGTLGDINGECKQMVKCPEDYRTDVLNSFAAVHSGDQKKNPTFVPFEAIVVDRTGQVFSQILQYICSLTSLHYGFPAAHPKYVIADCSNPLAYAVISVYNKVSLPEYVTYFLLEGKITESLTNTWSIRMNTRLVWCSIHVGRAFSSFPEKKLRLKRPKSMIDQLSSLFKGIHFFLRICKSYDDTCDAVGFLSVLLKVERFRVTKEAETSSQVNLISSGSLRSIGEKMTWRHVGGVPGILKPATKSTGISPDYLKYT